MKVGILCRLNQARSPLGALAMARLFPAIDFWSAGISPEPRSQFSNLAIDISKKWGLILPKNHCKSLQDVTREILQSELIISSDHDSETILKTLGFEGIFQSLDRLDIHKDFTPHDPIGLSLDKAEQEFAKFVYCLATVVENILENNLVHSITSMVPLSDSDSSLAYHLALFEIQNSDSVIIDADFRAPGAKVYLNNINSVQYDPIVDDLNKLVDAQTTRVFTPKKEFSNPVNILLNNKWLENLKRVANHRKVILMTSPRYTKEKRLPDSYIASIPSQTVKVISV